MNVTFVRSPGEPLRTTAIRGDGATVLVTGARDRKGLLPHDLAHFVVEEELGLGDGLWGSIADGRLYRGVHVVSGRADTSAWHRLGARAAARAP